mgnify:CR=1 FL=1
MNYLDSAILLASKDEDKVYYVKNVCKNINYNLVIEKDFYQFFKNLINLRPKFAFIDILAENLKEFPFKLLESSVFKDETKLVVLDENFISNNKFIDCVNLYKLESYILSSNFYLKQPNIEVVKVDRTLINNILLKLNFGPSLKGKEFLKESIYLILENRNYYGQLKNCFAQVAQKYCTRPLNVDRNIRTAISKAYKKQDKINWSEYFGVDISLTPTIHDFIFLCADKIIELYNI